MMKTRVLNTRDSGGSSWSARPSPPQQPWVAASSKIRLISQQITTAILDRSFPHKISLKFSLMRKFLLSVFLTTRTNSRSPASTGMTPSAQARNYVTQSPGKWRKFRIHLLICPPNIRWWSQSMIMKMHNLSATRAIRPRKTPRAGRRSKIPRWLT